MVTPYTEEISRKNPACIVFLIDQSGSMADKFGGIVEGVQNPTKAQGAADALNRCLYNIAIKCTKNEGVRDYFHIGVFGYGKTVGSVLSGQLSGQQLFPLSKFMDNPTRIEDRKQSKSDGAGGLVEYNIKFPVWVDPVADSNTPMRQALQEVKQLIGPWIAQYPNSFPPTLINITDGAATDGDPLPAASDLKTLANTNGSNLLMFSFHICSAALPPILYPAATNELPADDKYAEALFQMSSNLPTKLLTLGKERGLHLNEESRGFVFNGGYADLVRFLDIGTPLYAMEIRPES